MTQAAQYIDNPNEFWVWFVGVLDSVPNPKERDADFLFDISEESWDKYHGLAITAVTDPLAKAVQTLPDGKMLKKIVMSRSFEAMKGEDRRILIRIWAHMAVTSAARGTAPSEEFVEFIAFVLRKCPEHTLEKAVKHVRALEA